MKIIPARIIGSRSCARAAASMYPQISGLKMRRGAPSASGKRSSEKLVLASRPADRAAICSRDRLLRSAPRPASRESAKTLVAAVMQMSITGRATVLVMVDPGGKTVYPIVNGTLAPATFPRTLSSKHRGGCMCALWFSLLLPRLQAAQRQADLLAFPLLNFATREA